MDERLTLLFSRVAGKVRELWVTDGETAYIRDPVFPVIRNRVHAEFCKAMLRSGGNTLVGPILNYVAACQNPDGSWNEVHVNYNEPSALITAFIGDALIEAADRHPHEDALERARDFVLAAERSPGCFLKSAGYTADHLNVDASCGAFLARYAERYDDRIDRSIAEAARWLAAAQRPDGRFDWSGSGLSFACYLSGAYAFAQASFTYASRLDDRYREHADRSLDWLDANVRGLAPRWEPGSWGDLPLSVAAAVKSASLGGYPLRHRAFRFGYGVYREVARRRYSATAETRAFEALSGLLGIRSSTVEPSKNFPDLFMTSEMLDCLSQSMIWGKNT